VPAVRLAAVGRRLPAAGGGSAEARDAGGPGRGAFGGVQEPGGLVGSLENAINNTPPPGEFVSWDDVQKFLSRLDALEKAGGLLYRLPTEEEWEYACRGAATSPQECAFDFNLSQPTNDLSSAQANFAGDYPAGNAPQGWSLGRTTKVGSYGPNRLGLYDMPCWARCPTERLPGGWGGRWPR
jgi:hypothetical protein